MKKWLCGISLFLACVSAHAAVRPTLLWCDGCTAPQKRAKAATQSVGDTVYVGDTVANTFVAYSVGLRLDDSVSPPRQIVSPHLITADPAYADMESALLQFYNHAPVGWSKRIELNYPDPFAGVYDVVAISPAQNSMLDWVDSNNGYLINQLPIRIEQVVSVFKIIDPSKMPAMRITVRFTDGSRIDVDINYVTTNPDYRVVDDSGRDSHNNTVLSHRTSNPTRFDFR